MKHDLLTTSNQPAAALSLWARPAIKKALAGLAAALLFYALVIAITQWRGLAPSPAPGNQPTLPIAAAPQPLKVAAAAAATVSAVPAAVAPQTEHDFGTMPSSAAGEHVFLIRNEGDAPLKLSQGRTTCRCTLAEFPQAPVPPGETASVKVTWVTRGESFSQRATVRTNDPRRKEIQFTIRGQVSNPLGAEPSQVLFAGQRTGESETRRVTLYSQIWDDFQISRIEASDSRLKCTVYPADPITLKKLSAKSGYELEVSSLAYEQPGYFSESLQVVIEPQDPAQGEQSYTLAVNGSVSSRIAVYGIDARRVVSLGTVTAGQSVQRHLTMRVRDQSEPLHVERIEAQPSFLKVSCEPLSSAPSGVDLYRISLEVPADAPACAFSGEKKGYVRLLTDHPREKEVRFEVAFDVE